MRETTASKKNHTKASCSLQTRTRNSSMGL